MSIIYKLKKVIRDGKEMWLLNCPKCKIWASIDDDQKNGRVSILCYCGFHETINLVIKVKNNQAIFDRGKK